MPMKYFESRTYGEVLSRITNDVDTLGQGLNQSVTQVITSTATLIGVVVMMLTIHLNDINCIYHFTGISNLNVYSRKVFSEIFPHTAGISWTY